MDQVCTNPGSERTDSWRSRGCRPPPWWELASFRRQTHCAESWLAPQGETSWPGAPPAEGFESWLPVVSGPPSLESEKHRMMRCNYLKPSWAKTNINRTTNSKHLMITKQITGWWFHNSMLFCLIYFYIQSNLQQILLFGCRFGRKLQKYH